MNASATNGAAEPPTPPLSRGNFHVAKGPDWAQHPDLRAASPSDQTPTGPESTSGNNIFALG